MLDSFWVKNLNSNGNLEEAYLIISVSWKIIIQMDMDLHLGREVMEWAKYYMECFSKVNLIKVSLYLYRKISKELNKCALMAKACLVQESKWTVLDSNLRSRIMD